MNEFLSYFQSLGVRLWIDGEQLHYSASRGMLTPALKSQLRERKSEIIEFLQRNDIASSSITKSILPIARDVNLPLSFAQQRLWFLQQLEPRNPFYNENFAVQLTGSLDVGTLEQSLNAIVQRHESLRTNFRAVAGQAVQIIAPELVIDLLLIDLQNLSETEKKIELQRLATEQHQNPFDLAQDSLIRWMLLKLNEHKHVLLIAVHHIAIDGWSLASVFPCELLTFYQAFSTGKPVLLPELPIQYADFAVWQRQHLKGEKLESQLSYWKQQLSNAPPLLQLPSDRPRPLTQTYQGARQAFQLTKDLTKTLKAVALKAESTLFMTLLAAFKILLYRYTGQEDIIVGSAIANRNRAEIERLIGFFVNTLVLRTSVSGNPTFEELLGRVRKVMIGAYTHQDLPFEKVVEELQPERNANYNQLFQVSFVLQNTLKLKVELPELTITPFEIESTRALFDLHLDITETDAGLECFWEYSTDLFDAARISRMSGHFQTLLEAISANPQQRISQLPLLSETEQHQLLMEWNQTQIDYPKNICIHQLFEAQVEKTPDAVAIVFEEQQLTYRELNQRANQLAHYLSKLAVKPETLVGICMERSLEVMIVVLGILKAGGAYVPLDPAYPQERLAFMLTDSQISVLLTTKQLSKHLPKHQAYVVELDTNWEFIFQGSEENFVAESKSESLAYVIYTSGSTGKPKGVLVAHQGLCNLAKEQIQLFNVQPGSRILQFASLSFDASIWEVVMALGSGATLCLGTSTSLLPGQALMELLRDQEITHVTLPPTALAVLPTKELPALCTIIVAGEVCSTELIAEWSKNRRFFNAYGPTESTVCATVYECIDASQKPLIGRPIANTQIYILDCEGLPTPIGVPGELHIGGKGLARGYLNRPELTAQKFVANPFSNEPGNCLYKTGDLCCYLPDGNVKFLGRIDHQVKVRGFRIELEEIEAALLQYPEINEALVIVREDHPDDKRIVAYLVCNQEQIPTVNQLQNFLKKKLPNYMIPSAFVVLDTIPLTPNGKVDRGILPPPESRPQLEEAYVMPQTEVEKFIATVWKEMLQIEKVGINDNFFSIGGNSLLLIKIQAKLNEVFRKELLIIEFFKYPTIKELAQYITNKSDFEKTESASSELIYDRAYRQKEAIKRHKQLVRRQMRKVNE
ncbi:MAG: amino acid adenylation domain-containing protein [Leptolyngbya sp. SIO1E4]|nr:amino acid adenylation domain-containing protein [Leptolyngbya sp. SIO1E4]